MFTSRLLHELYLSRGKKFLYAIVLFSKLARSCKAGSFCDCFEFKNPVSDELNPENTEIGISWKVVRCSRSAFSYWPSVCHVAWHERFNSTWQRNRQSQLKSRIAKAVQACRAAWQLDVRTFMTQRSSKVNILAREYDSNTTTGLMNARKFIRE